MDFLENEIPFTTSDLDIQNYTAELISNCVLHGIISDEKVIEIRSCIETEFIEIAEQNVKRESSTISKQNAELICNSIMYQADVYLLHLNSICLVISELKNRRFSQIINDGKMLIQKIYDNNFNIFKTAFMNRLNIDNYEYNYVMNKSFDEYAKNYSGRFDARNCCTIIDYPLLGRPAYNIKLQGVMFIAEYYTGLMYENIFCKYFKENNIIDILAKYGEMYKCCYKDLSVNICEVLLNNLLAAALIGKHTFDLNITDIQLIELREKFLYQDKKYIKTALRNSFSIYRNIFLNDELYNYLERYIDAFSDEFEHHLSNDTLNKFIVLNCD